MVKKIFFHTPKVLAIFLAFWLLAFPAMMQAQVGGNAVAEAEKQAKSDVSAILWIAGGCLIGPLAVAIGYLVPLQKAPAQALVGKSAQYVSSYNAAYEKKVKGLQGKNALIGCGVSVIGWVIYVVLIAAAD